MSKRKRAKEGERSPSPSNPNTLKGDTPVILQPGFYIVTNTGEVLTRIVGKLKTGEDGVKEKVQVEEPICCRTIAAAKDTCSIANRTSNEHAILCVTVENFAWGE